MIAVANQHVAIVDLLLERGADPNRGNLFCRNPLMFAARYGNLRLTETLLIMELDSTSVIAPTLTLRCLLQLGLEMRILYNVSLPPGPIQLSRIVADSILINMQKVWGMARSRACCGALDLTAVSRPRLRRTNRTRNAVKVYGTFGRPVLDPFSLNERAKRVRILPRRAGSRPVPLFTGMTLE